MSTIKEYDEEIEAAKEEVIQAKRLNWINEYKRKYPDAVSIPEPPIDEITPKAWFITRWRSGYIVADLQELMKLPKRNREKIFALGGLQ